jgi:hypothetical protein
MKRNPYQTSENRTGKLCKLLAVLAPNRTNRNTKLPPASRRSWSRALLVAVAGLLTGNVTTIRGAAPPLPGSAVFHGNTLEHWQELWFRWSAGVLNVPTDANGNAVLNNVVLLSIPNTPGDGTPGSLNLTLSVGQAFVLPLDQLSGNSYRNGTPNDQMVAVSDFLSGSVRLTLDGVTIVSGANLAQYYT